MAEFIPLAQSLRAAEAAPPPAPAPAPQAIPPEIAADRGAGERACEADLALIRIAAIESFENAVRLLLERIAGEVLGRELALAPCELGVLVAAARAELEAHEPFCIVTAPEERAEFSPAFPRRRDPALAPGDLFVEVRGGAFDASLRVRLRHALEGLGE